MPPCSARFAQLRVTSRKVDRLAVNVDGCPGVPHLEEKAVFVFAGDLFALFASRISIIQQNGAVLVDDERGPNYRDAYRLSRISRLINLP